METPKEFVSRIFEEGEPAPAFNRDSLDEFTRAYLEAILFAEMDNSDERGGEPLDRNYEVEDFSPAAMKMAIDDCTKFQAENGEDIDNGCLTRIPPREQAGHDLWFTRVGHGVGYWEKSDWEEQAGERLDAAAKALGEIWVYVGDDGKLHLSR